MPLSMVRIPGISLVAFACSRIAWLKYRLPINSLALVARLRKEQSVLIVAGDQCGMPKHIRIGFGTTFR